MSVRILLAFSNMLFTEGIRRILEDEKSIKVTEVLAAGVNCTDEMLKSINPDVILIDFVTLYNGFNSVSTGKNKYILLDTLCGKDNIISTILSKKLSGVLLKDASPRLLKKAVKAVSSGDVWIDKSTVKNILYGINALGKNKTSELSNREKDVVALISHGYKNREIAAKLCISESTVKTHLSKVFQKLDIKNRAQLITYALKNENITNFHTSRTNH
jgi:DNA-binding NarL/FixJ family response regulator